MSVVGYTNPETMTNRLFLLFSRTLDKAATNEGINTNPVKTVITLGSHGIVTENHVSGISITWSQKSHITQTYSSSPLFYYKTVSSFYRKLFFKIKDSSTYYYIADFSGTFLFWGTFWGFGKYSNSISSKNRISGETPMPKWHFGWKTIRRKYKISKTLGAKESLFIPYGVMTNYAVKHYVEAIRYKMCVVDIVIKGKRWQVKCKLRIGSKILNILKKIRIRIGINRETALYALNSKGKNLITYEGDENMYVCSDNTFGGHNSDIGDLVDSESSDDDTEDTSELRNNGLDDQEMRDEIGHQMISLFYSNVSGGLGGNGNNTETNGRRMNFQKETAIKACSMADTIYALCETNAHKHDTNRLARAFGKEAFVEACDDFAYDRAGDRICRAENGKSSGFGMAVISKESGLLTGVEVQWAGNLRFEIVATLLERQGKTGLIIAVYRSPSMKRIKEIEEFYKTISMTIKKYKEEKRPDFILYIGDDNKSNVRIRQKLHEHVEKLSSLKNLIGNTPTRIDKNSNRRGQPDTCYGWWNPFKVSIDARVSGKITKEMDHRVIRVFIKLHGVTPREPTFRTVKRKVRSKSDEDISAFLAKMSEEYIKTYEPINRLANEINGNIVDACASDYDELIKKVKEYGWKEISVQLPDCVRDDDDAITVKIGYERAKMERIALRLKNNPDDIMANEEFNECEKNTLSLMRQKVESMLDLDLKHQRNKKVNTENYYKWSKRFLAKDGFLTETLPSLSHTEKMKKLEEHDKTFIDPDPNYKPNYEEVLKNVQPERKYNLNRWDPDNLEHPDMLKQLILNKTKIDKFYKKHVDVIVKPLFVLLRMIELSDYFPKRHRTSKATFIPGRTIFSLETLVKIIESVFTTEFEICTELDFKVNGDPLGCAYTKNRGTESCNAISYTLVDIALMQDGKAACQVVCDLKKAFNSAHRETIIAEAERIAGAGRLLVSRSDGRTYSMDDMIRGQGANKGTDAGTPVAVWQFKCFMNTDRFFSGYNKKLMWAAMFSDDRSPLWRALQVIRGFMQQALDGTCEWAKKMRCEYHLEGKKKPELLVYRNIKIVEISKTKNEEEIQITAMT